MEMLYGLIERYQEDPMRLISLMVWITALIASALVAKNTRLYGAHVLYTVANIGMVIFNVHTEQWELVLMGATFTATSLMGLRTHSQKKVLSKAT